MKMLVYYHGINGILTAPASEVVKVIRQDIGGYWRIDFIDGDWCLSRDVVWCDSEADIFVTEHIVA